MSKFMTYSQSSRVSAFSMQGRLVDFVIKDGYKLKGLQIATGEGQVYVKLAKHLQINFNWFVPPGTFLQLYGEKKFNGKAGEYKFKAQRVTTVEDVDNVWTKASSESSFPSPVACNHQNQPQATKSNNKTKATILVCQKSDCMKRGGRQLCQALETAVSDRGLENQVKIKGTGCMKSCKAGPNLVMPDKTRYKRIQADQVPELLNKHFAHSNNDESSEIEIMVAANTVSMKKIHESHETVEIFS